LILRQNDEQTMKKVFILVIVLMDGMQLIDNQNDLWFHDEVPPLDQIGDD
jgi:hypothetical protein